MGVARGKKIVITDETCTCAGGAVGLGFGDAFVRRNHPTWYLLSTGMEDVPKGEQVTLLPYMQESERFFCGPYAVDTWKHSLPFVHHENLYVVFSPVEAWEEHDEPDLVCLFVNPDLWGQSQ